ncbi:EamA family transporter [Agrobacterium fabrum]|uniref:DMT family transporter n=1 Tax=Agrobacterium fabrum TaxID=1176649 RepID=UPI000EF5A80C|nr:EamA family transporter [Agrobacterium fabrum]AYM65807.1 hypothetical protein At12D13_46550 [Agrobacterium fabrum]NTE63635.1 EamA family transporter [Agrobacterium fabrum]
MNLPGHQIAGSNQRARCTQSRILVLLPVGYQWSYNGANFVAFKIGGDAVHPLLLASMRFAIIGTHLLPAGVASVFGSAAPLFLALFSWIVLREPLGLWQVYGDALGFTGLVLMAWFTSHSGRFSPLGAALTLAASGCWAGGSLWARRLRLPADPIVTLVTQLVSAATVLIILARASGVADQTDLAHLPASAWWAVAFLVIANTLIGYAVFLAVIHDVSPLIANTFNYASPVVALLLLSAALLAEPLTLPKLFAAGVALSGVALMVRGSSAGRRGPRKNTIDDKSRPTRNQAGRTLSFFRTPCSRNHILLFLEASPITARRKGYGKHQLIAAIINR